ncbi:MAG: hypothetical protein HDR12_03065 [Lachnospiraceae bacterium]|nr:hypothetical protein [Lachnospiraceae bacterium]
MHKSFNVAASSIYPLGVKFVPEGLHISAVCEKNTDFGIVLFDKKNKSGIKIPFPKEYRRGNIYSMLLEGYQDRDCSYLFYQGEALVQDPYAMALENDRKYGEKKKTPSHCKVQEHSYDWNGDKFPAYSFEDSVFYMMHVRGFTKHKSSGVSCRGTYAGVVEKIPYLKELGITAVLLMPSYEFDEVFKEENQKNSIEQAATEYNGLDSKPSEREDVPVRVNYWGYQEGLYFMPKYNYSYKKDAVTEFKDMVKALHQNEIEIMMQFYFPPSISHIKILEILKYWVLEYHIDGFQLMGVDIPMQMLRKEPLLAETKLIGEKDDYYENSAGTGNSDTESVYKNFGFMNDAFLYDMRKLLKGDANMIDSLMNLCRKNYSDKGVVNYIAKQSGFCLYDLVSYNGKHNEANGEDNKDGIAENNSWNCGVEGKTRKKGILELRMRQMKNAMSFVMLSQGTPLIYSGDEFANSQEGNNNPYCQDNPVCWLQWNRLNTNEELFNYVKELIAMRKANSILHAKMPLRGTDYLSCGFPDISFHGKDAWIPDTSSESRSLGILYCGMYGSDGGKTDNSLFYIAINMHWEPYQFGLPQTSKGLEWKPLMTTCVRKSNKDDTAKKSTAKESTGTTKNEKNFTMDFSDNKIGLEENRDNILVPPRSIVIYGTKVVETGKEKKAKGSRSR